MSTPPAEPLTRETYLAVGILMILCSTVFVLVRCVMAFQQHDRLMVDDYFSITALAFMVVIFSLNDVIITEFTNPAASQSWLVKMGIVITVLIAIALWACKAPILLLYVKLFGVHRWLRYSCYLTLALSGVLMIAAMAPTFAWCRFGDEPLQAGVLNTCVHGTTLTGVITGFITTPADVVILLLPMPAIYELRLDSRRKYGLAVVFFSGFLGIIASVVSLYYKYQIWLGNASATLTTCLCSVAECTAAIIVGCAPALKAFWSTVMPQHFQTISQYATHHSLFKMSSKTTAFKPQKDFPRTADKNVNDAYIFMETPRRSLDRVTQVGSDLFDRGYLRE